MQISIELILFLPDHANWTVMSIKNDENDQQERNPTRESQFGFIYINEKGILEFLIDGMKKNKFLILIKLISILMILNFFSLIFINIFFL